MELCLKKFLFIDQVFEGEVCERDSGVNPSLQRLFDELKTSYSGRWLMSNMHAIPVPNLEIHVAFCTYRTMYQPLLELPLPSNTHRLEGKGCMVPSNTIFLCIFEQSFTHREVFQSQNLRFLHEFYSLSLLKMAFL